MTKYVIFCELWENFVCQTLQIWVYRIIMNTKIYHKLGLKGWSAPLKGQSAPGLMDGSGTCGTCVNLRRGAHLPQNIPQISRYILNYFNDIGLEEQACLYIHVYMKSLWHAFSCHKLCYMSVIWLALWCGVLQQDNSVTEISRQLLKNIRTLVAELQVLTDGRTDGRTDWRRTTLRQQNKHCIQCSLLYTTTATCYHLCHKTTQKYPK